MKIIVFYGGYLPGEKYGGPVTSIYNFTELLGDDNDIFIVCANHDLKETIPYSGIQPGWNKVGKAHVLYLHDFEYGKKKFSSILDEISPELIYVSSFFSVKQTYPLFALSKTKNIPLLLAPRGELNNSALNINGTKKRLYIIILKLLRKMTSTFFQATSVGEKKNIIQNLGVDEKKVFLLPNIPTIPVHKKCIEKQVGIMRMCFVGRIVPNKNLLVVIKALALLGVAYEIRFDIYGSCEDKDYWDLCQKAIHCLPSNIKTTYKGIVSYRIMKNSYAYYDCLISPTEFENYGQAIVEAMLHDVPVIISKETTPWDDIYEKQVGMTIKLDDINGFAKAIETIAIMDTVKYMELIKRLRIYCIDKFDYSKLRSHYSKIFKRIISSYTRGNN